MNIETSKPQLTTRRPPSDARNIRFSIWRRLRRLRYLLMVRDRFNSLVLERAAGYPILVLPQVFNPRLFRTGEVLARALNEQLIPPGSQVLDMGTGSGIGAVAAARWAERVVAVDVNPEAVRCARINAMINRVEDRVEVREGDLFGPVRGERFDVILYNPPYFAGEPRSLIERAFYSNDAALRFAANLCEHLAPGGYVLMLLSTDGEPDQFLDALDQAGMASQPLVEKDLLSEILTIYQVRRRESSL